MTNKILGTRRRNFFSRAVGFVARPTRVLMAFTGKRSKTQDPAPQVPAAQAPAAQPTKKSSSGQT